MLSVRTEETHVHICVHVWLCLVFILGQTAQNVIYEAVGARLVVVVVGTACFKADLRGVPK